jgi:Na+/H+ antiporter
MYTTIELILGLLIAVAGLAVAARGLAVPLPILLVLCGVVLGFVPGVPEIVLDPELVFLFFMPPLLYKAASMTSWHDFRRNIRPIVLLAVGLVLATMLAVAAAAHAVMGGLSWPAAFVLGAIVSPPDAVAATAVFQRLGVHRRIVTVLEGEALVNDATALVLYQMAIAATLTGKFSLTHAALDVVVEALGGVAIGLLVAGISTRIRNRLNHPPVEITISLLTPFAAYLPAERLGMSAVLAVVAAGLYAGWRLPRIATSETRLQVYAVWETVDFLLNGLVFILIGLQLPIVLDEVRASRSPGQLALDAVVVSGIVVLVRFLWLFPAAIVPRLFNRRSRRRDPLPSWQALFLMSWSGMRGVVSLAAALALPLATQHGAPFPQRNNIIFLTFCVILATLVLQGVSLPALISLLKVHDDRAADKQETEARLAAAHAALEYIDALAAEADSDDDRLQRLRRRYQDRIHHLSIDDDHPDYAAVQQSQGQFELVLREALNAERRVVIELRDTGYINDDVLRRIQRDLDLEESRLAGR